MRSASIAVFAALAMPAVAQAPAFRVAVACDGAMPVGIEVTATRPGSTVITVEELMAFCMLHAPVVPEKQRWRSTT